MTMIEQFVTRPQGREPSAEALCAACAKAGTCCCKTDPALTHLSFPLSAPEWHRLLPYSPLATLSVPALSETFEREEREAAQTAGDLAANAGFLKAARRAQEEATAAVFPAIKNTATGWPGDAVCALEPNSKEFITPMLSLFPRHKKAVTSLFPPDGAHYSLRTREDGSCVFLGDAGCRLPREVRPWYCLIFPAWVIEGCLTLFISEYCLIAQEARNPAHGAALLNLPPARIRELHRALMRDWGLEPSNSQSERSAHLP